MLLCVCYEAIVSDRGGLEDARGGVIVFPIGVAGDPIPPLDK